MGSGLLCKDEKEEVGDVVGDRRVCMEYGLREGCGCGFMEFDEDKGDLDCVGKG